MKLTAVNLHLNNECNLRCRHCLYESGEIAIEGFRFPVLRGWIEQFAELMGDGGTLNLFGGEPLLHPDILPIIDHASSLGLSVGITTNGVLEGKFTELLRTPVSRVSIDLHGATKEQHDFVRNFSGHYEISLDRIKEAVAAGKSVGVNSALARFNSGHVEDLLKLCADLRVANISFYLLSPAGRGKSLLKDILNADEWLTIRDKIFSWCKTNNPAFGVIWERCYDHKENFAGVVKSMCRSAIADTLDVRSDGVVIPCGLLMSAARPFAPNGPILGSLQTTSLKEIIETRGKHLFSDGEGCPALALHAGEHKDVLWHDIGKYDPRAQITDAALLCPYEWQPLWGNLRTIRKTHAHVCQELS
ncbi:Radical SAM domain heme biosynthesis protein [Methanosarcina sp. Kolksee]|uniref:radical SAM protein n=1 Tax=Methanosarcina sp. Kolksee TaxID=1434099 RepID=UPI00061615F8|nr:radical SAM protein [Methanosarcina sp. Kolksee]AKB47813.1 Radical SAM domain heme biosynthesis protein [Methanosarcina sp. Kolksee]